MRINVIDVLKILNEGQNYLVKVNNYNKIGNEVVDEFDMFERSAVSIPTPFELQGNENRLNISVQNQIYGVVTINPIQAKRVNLPKIIETPKMYRTKTVIVDGKLNIENLEVIIDNTTYFQLKKYNVNFEELENPTSYPGHYILLQLTGLPISNKQDFTLDEILENVEKLNELKAKQRVLNALNKKLPSESNETIPGYNEEQTQVLKDHGLNEKLVYVGIENKVKEAKEVYEGDIIEFKVKNSTMSSFSDVLKRISSGKKLNTMDQIQYDFYNQVLDKTKALDLNEVDELRNFYKSELKKIKNQIFYITLRNTMIKIAFKDSALNEVLFDSEGNFGYKGKLTINYKSKQFSK